MSYQEKYLKYKNKYLTLKNQNGGSNISEQDVKIPIVNTNSSPEQIEMAMKKLGDLVKCPVCLTNIKSIIFCIEGHGCCNSCFHELKRKNVLQCPVCRGPKLANPRNIL
jgi:hypothetical protein